MTRRDQRTFDLENKVSRAKKDKEGNFLKDDGKTYAANTTDLKDVNPGRKNNKGQYLDADNNPIKDGDSSALASDYPYPV